ncbi:MAG: hypothetical protein LIO95_05715, partial [Clostridiales bacterium]|nr:hypothetical protein [Clostridiales bacterium]
AGEIQFQELFYGGEDLLHGNCLLYWQMLVLVCTGSSCTGYRTAVTAKLAKYSSRNSSTAVRIFFMVIASFTGRCLFWCVPVRPVLATGQR